MGTFSKMEFSPADGLKNKDAFITTPVSEDDARKQVQDVVDQIKDYINNDLIGELENAETNNSGAGKIGSQPIENVSGTTVFDQIFDLKSQLDTAVADGFTTGSVSTVAIANAAVTHDKIADNAVGESQIIDGSVTADKIEAGAVTQSKFADYSVSGSKIAEGAVSETKIEQGAVTEMKLGVGAVTVTKLGAGAVTEIKIGDGAVSAAKISSSAKTDSVSTVSSSILASATAAKTAYDRGQSAYALAATKENALITDQKRKITISASAPSGGVDGDVWLEIIS